MKKTYKSLLYIIIILILQSCILNTKPPKPILKYPTKLNNLPLSIDFYWDLEGNVVLEDINYIVKYGTNKNLLDRKITTSNKNIRIENLSPETTYYLQIISVKGNEINESDIYEFTTTDIPKVKFLTNKNIIYENHILLSWDAEDKDGIKKYELYISKSNDFFDIVDLGLNKSYYIENLNTRETYYFKIVAYDNLNTFGEDILQINVGNLEFFNFNPTNNSRSIPLNNVKLSFEYTGISDDFTLIFSPNDDLSNDLKYYLRKNISSKEFTLNSLPEGTTFYWKIIDNKNKIESSIQSFTTSYKPEIKITYPVKNKETENYPVGMPENLKITWNATDIDNDNLTFFIKLKEVSMEDKIENIDFSRNLLIDDSTKNMYYNVNGLKKGSYYAFKVIADDGKGNEVSSEIVKFKTNVGPDNPYELFPNKIIDVDTKVATLTWKCYDPDNELNYRIYYGESSTDLILEGETSKNYYTLKNLKNGTTYFWQVEAIDTNNATSISDIATFTTNKKPIFKSVEPTNNIVNISLKTKLKWFFEDTNLAYYNLYISKDNEPLSLLATLTENYYDLNILPETKYKWEVLAFDVYNASASSGINYFETTNKPQIQLLTPTSFNESLKPVFSWDATDIDNDKLNYKLYIYNNGNIIDEISTDSTIVKYTNFLESNMEYTWEVIVEDSNFATAIASSNFTTSRKPVIELIYPISEENLGSTVTLTWNATDIDNDDIYYEIYLDDTKIGTTTNKNYSVSGLLPDTLYTWKVVAIDSNLATNTSIEATFTTDKSPNNKPNITNIYGYDENGNLNKELSLNEEKYPNVFKIIWGLSNNSSYYNVYKSKDGIESIIASNLTNNNTIIYIPDGGKYNLYVKAFNDKGFYTKGDEISLEINKPPIILDYSPRENESNISLHPTIIWKAEDYDSKIFTLRMYFGYNKEELNEEYMPNTQTEGEYTIKTELNPGTKYYWKIKLEDEMNGVTETEFREFTTTYRPEFKSVNLSDYATNISLNYNLQWEGYDKDNDNLSYTIKLNGNKLKENLKSNAYTLNLESDKNYLLELLVIDDKGTENSTILNFSTTRKPIIYNNSMYVEDTNHFKNGDKIYWNAYDPDNDEIYYEIYLGTSQNSLTKIATTTEKEYKLNNLIEGKTYYWKIKVYDNKGAVSESDIKSFKTNTSPNIQNIYYPKNNSIGIERNVTLYWEATDSEKDKLKYDIYFGDTKNNLVKVASDYVYTSYNINNLENGKTYYWKIVAKDGFGGESESEIYDFTTNSPPVFSKINYELYNGLELKINWEVKDPEGQTIRFDLLESFEDSNYSTILYNVYDIEKYLGRLLPDTNYYLKIRAIDEKNDYVESTITFKTNNIDTNIFTIERGNNNIENSIIDLKEVNSNEYVFIEKQNNEYYLTKIDYTGTETTKDSSITINYTPYFIENNANLLIIGIKDDQIIFEEYDNNLNLISSNLTNIFLSSIKDFIKISDNEYIILGENSGNNYIINILNGLKMLEKNFGNTKLYSIIKIYDYDSKEKFILSGEKNNKGYMAKLDKNFNLEDEKIVDIDKIVKLENNERDFFAVGFINNDLVIKGFSYRLNELYKPIYENNFYNSFVDIVKVDNGYLMALNNNEGDIEILELDNNINVINKHYFGREYEDKAMGIIKTSDNGYIIFGQTKFSDHTYGNSYIIKTDSNLDGWSTP
ncbi:fibronectin type III domain-containing protein [Marinitoga sp. 38H-ov]|uniref:fibronectin type III domain-containing protein n=1 Tax=Marinitoga sp. 38H-ov TaxID=1755814 RepID=UPI0013EDF28C|nr:fibronectin type III domain-containing protein [Marinitoga sp. 38H-ov]KAF2955667.1 hypothetical protein AS160_00710 [Marinitoga sp. 38H-ov]